MFDLPLRSTFDCRDATDIVAGQTSDSGMSTWQHVASRRTGKDVVGCGNSLQLCYPKCLSVRTPALLRVHWIVDL